MLDTFSLVFEIIFFHLLPEQYNEEIRVYLYKVSEYLTPLYLDYRRLSGYENFSANNADTVEKSWANRQTA